MFTGRIDIRHVVEVLLQTIGRAEASGELHLGLDESECSLGEIVFKAHATSHTISDELGFDLGFVASILQDIQDVLNAADIIVQEDITSSNADGYHVGTNKTLYT